MLRPPARPNGNGGSARWSGCARCGGKPMVDLEALAVRARRTAEWSRVRMACRIAPVVAPLALAPLIGGAALETCACLVAALFAVAVLLRWRSRLGVAAVRDGLLLG